MSNIKTVDDFYKAKYKYSQRVNQYIKSLRRSELTNNEKKQSMSSKKFACIQCKNPVNTFFSNTNRKLTVLCGAAVQSVPGYTPCSLNVEINLPKIILIDQLLIDLNLAKTKINEQIILNKLNHMYNYSSEEKSIELYDKQRKDLETINDRIDKYLKEYNNRFENPEIDILKTTIETTIAEIKELMKTNANEQALIIQIEQLIPLCEELRNLTYSYYNIEEESSKLGIKSYKLISQKQSISSREVEI